MKLPEAPWRRRPGMAELLAALGGGEQTRFVGGAIRDTLLGLPVSDVDLATRLQPEEVVERLRAARIKAVPTGIAHGTITAVSAGTPVEVTTLRRDIATDGRHATVEFTDDWMEDAARRDFTINAFYAEPETGEVQDFFGGQADLENRLVRFIGDPLTRIAEDHLRILRFFRFHARFGRGEPDAAGLEACASRANDLMALSRERIADELLKLLALPEPAGTVRLMAERGIFRPFLPEVDEAGIERVNRLISRERATCAEPDALRRLAALLSPDPVLAESIAGRLRLSNAARKRLVLAAEPLRDGQTARSIYGGSTLFLHEVLDLLLLSDFGEDWVVHQADSLQGWERPDFPLRGRDLLELGLPPGPVVAEVLQKVRQAWIRSDFPGVDTVRALARAHVAEALDRRE